MTYKQQGLSLVELMIALTIGIVLMTGVAQMFLSSKQVFSTQKGVSRVQETGRLAMEFLARDIREAGYMGCLSRTAFNYTSTLNDPDDDYMLDFETAIKATAATATDDLGVNLEPKPIGPVLALRSAAGAGVGLASDKTNKANLDVYNTGESSGGCHSGLCVGDILAITDCAKARVFQASTVQPNKSGTEINIVHASASGKIPPGNAFSNWDDDDPASQFKKGSEVIKIRTRLYYIADADPGDDNVRPGLYMKEGLDPSVELLKNVEEMYLQFGIDTNADSIVDNYVKQDVVANWNNVLAVKVDLLVASTEDNIATDAKVYDFGEKTGVVSPDKRIRQTFSNTIGIRSRLQ